MLAYCHQHGIKVVARGAGTSLSGGALPAEDAVVVGVSRMNRVLEIDYMNRIARVEVGITNLGISDVVKARGFFYAPDPSSQLACTLAGNIGMNSGGAHCLKYGVTTNNVLGLKMVLMDGEVVEIGGAAPRFARLRPAGPGDRLGGPARHRHRGDRAHPARGRRRAAHAARLRLQRGRRPVRRRHHRRRHHPRRHRVHGPAGDPRLRGLRQGRLSARGRGAADRRGGGLERGDRRPARRHHRASPSRSRPRRCASARAPSRAPPSGRAARRRSAPSAASPTTTAWTASSRSASWARCWSPSRTSATSTACKVANIFHAGDGNLHPLVLYDANDEAQAERAEQAGDEILELCVASGGCLTGEHGVGIEKRDLMRVQFTETDLALQMRIKTVFDPKWLLNPAKVFPLEGRERGAGSAREESGSVLANMRPVDEREFSRVLAEATATHTPLEVMGSGSKQQIGRPMQTAANVSTKGLRGITLYEPSEMVMSARAGTPLEQIEEALAGARADAGVRAHRARPARRAASRPGHHRRRVRHQHVGRAAHQGRRGARSPAGRAGRQRPRRDLQVRRPGDEERHRRTTSAAACPAAGARWRS